jgi:hypothetical protein
VLIFLFVLLIAAVYIRGFGASVPGREEKR